MSRNEELSLKLSLSNANASKLVTYIYAKQKEELAGHYAFFRAVYDHIKKTKVDKKRVDLVDGFMLDGYVLDTTGKRVPILGEYNRYIDCAKMIIKELTVDGKLSAPKKGDYSPPRPNNQTKFSFYCDEGEQSLEVNTNDGVVEYDISRNNHNVDDAKGTWLYKAIYSFVNTHKFTRNEGGSERYFSEYDEDPSYTYYGEELKHENEKQKALARHFAKKRR